MFESIRRSLFLVVAVAFLFLHAAVAQVATAQRARQEGSARESWQRVPEIFEALAVRPGSTVAVVGAGGGFLTVRLSRAVGPTGRVMDNDQTGDPPFIPPNVAVSKCSIALHAAPWCFCG